MSPINGFISGLEEVPLSRWTIPLSSSTTLMVSKGPALLVEVNEFLILLERAIFMTLITNVSVSRVMAFFFSYGVNDRMVSQNRFW